MRPNYKEIAKKIDEHFTKIHPYDGRTDIVKKRYEFRMPELHHRLNYMCSSDELEYISNYSGLNSIINHLKKLGWQTTNIRGMYKKYIWI